MSIHKKIFFIFMTVFFLPGVVFANDDISIALLDSQVELGETIVLQVEYSGEGSAGVLVNGLEGIENFEVFSRGQQHSYQNINGEIYSRHITTFEMRAKAVGVFSLGPVSVRVGDTTIEDDGVLEVEVVAVGTGAGTVTPSIAGNTIQEQEAVVYPELKPLKYYTLSRVIVFALLLMFLGGIYFVIHGILKIYAGGSPEVKQQKTPDDPKAWEKALIKRLQETPNDDFLQVYNEVLREILIKQGYSITLSMTLYELKKVANIYKTQIFTIFQQSYIDEYKYREGKLSGEKKNNYIDKLSQEIL